MADFTLSPPGSSQNPWNPANIIIVAGTLQATTAQWKPGSFVYTPFAHNVNYGTTIEATCTLNASTAGDDVFVGDIVRSGANAGAGIGVFFQSTQCAAGTINAAGTFSAVSTAVSITRAAADVLDVTVSISGGTATITAKQNGGSITFSANTTTTFAGEASLAAGVAFQPQNSNGTALNLFTGTGVAPAGQVPNMSYSLQPLLAQ